MAELDLTDRLIDELQEVAPVFGGYLDNHSGIGIYPTAGSRTLSSFMNRTRQDGMHYNVSLISDSPQAAESTLNAIAEHLRNLPNGGIKSSNGSFTYLQTTVITPPFISRVVDENRFEYTMTLEVEVLR